MEGSLQERISSFIQDNIVVIVIGIVGLIFLGYGLMSLSGSEDKKDDIVFESAKESLPAKSSPTASKKLMVDVAGAVVNPGVYELEPESRVQDAIVEAGGMRSEADQQKIAQGMNLAAKLTDGAKIYLPFEGEEVSLSEGNSVLVESNAALVNINTASASQLESLPGVGPVTAEKIMASRPYANLEELVQKKAVGKSLYQKIKDQISL